MYRLLIVDDEEIEREGMAQLIPWGKYDVELAGTAWNGADGLEKIRFTRPDIVLTDIKMPVMDGIGLIRTAKEEFPAVEFIVLSGYGEYEYTSQAMELGVRHYVLKPCDEERIAEVLCKAKEEIEQKRRQERKVEDYRQTVQRLLPRAREQILRNLLLEREELTESGRRFLKEAGVGEAKIRVMGFRVEKGFDELEQFILENVLRELIGKDSVLESTCIDEEIVFLVKDAGTDQMRKAVKRIYRELEPFAKRNLLAAASSKGSGQYGSAGGLLQAAESG